MKIERKNVKIKFLDASMVKTMALTEKIDRKHEKNRKTWEF